MPSAAVAAAAVSAHKGRRRVVCKWRRWGKTPFFKRCSICTSSVIGSGPRAGWPLLLPPPPLIPPLLPLWEEEEKGLGG